jgi:hypothetical protein
MRSGKRFMRWFSEAEIEAKNEAESEELRTRIIAFDV